MKKLNLLLGAGLMILASCSSDEVVKNPLENANEAVPMGFATRTPNMSRAGANATALEEQMYDFGVYAYKHKKTSETDSTTQTVMEDYLVGYWDPTTGAEKGYEPKKSQVLFASDATYWYYEALGSGDAGFTFHSSAVQADPKTSNKANQYLKYWDPAYTNTDFYAYAPYNTATYASATSTLTFPEVTAATGAGYMYASARYTNSAMVTPAGNYDGTTFTTGKYVDLTFYRLLSKIRVAFYETVPGYKVKITGFNTTKYTIPAGDTYAAFGGEVMTAVPTNYDGTTYTADGTYTDKGVLTVKFNGAADATKAEVKYTSSTTSSKNIDIPLWFKKNAAADWAMTSTFEISEEPTDYTLSEVCDVLPADKTVGKGNSGFTLNLNLQFRAEDTNETIDVKGVRVFVPATYTQWQPNFLYTYVFKITKNVPGNSTDVAPAPGPDPNPYLVPIVFDKVTVEAFEDNEVEYPFDIN